MTDFMKEANQNDLRENRNPNWNEKINIYSETETNIKLKRDIFKVRCTSRRPTLGGRDKQKTTQTLTRIATNIAFANIQSNHFAAHYTSGFSQKSKNYAYYLEGREHCI